MCIGMANGGKIMTLQEAITTLKREYLGDSEFMELAKQMGANALDKQIPKKPIEDGYYDLPCVCPNCGSNVANEDGNDYQFKYCYHCG